MRFLAGLIFAAVLVGVSIFAFAGEPSGLTPEDFAGGYIIGREIGGPKLIQAQLVMGADGLEITQLMQGTKETAPEVICTGLADVDDHYIYLNFICPSPKGPEQYRSKNILPDGPLDLKVGFEVTLNNHHYRVRKESKPVF